MTALYHLNENIAHLLEGFLESAVPLIAGLAEVIGLFIIGSVLVNSAIGNVEDQVTIQAYISDNASDEDVEDYQDELERMDNVKNVEFVSKEDALEEYSSTISGNADATLSALDGQNPLPRSFRIEMEDPSQVEAMAEKIKDDSGFRKIVDDADPEVDDKDADVAENVRYGKEEVGRLFQLTGYIRVAAVVLVALLTFVAFIFINNTIRLSITARRREIAIMRLVGASNGFIRGPFLMEGALHAIIGSLLAVGCLELLRTLALPKLQSALMFLNFDLSLNTFLFIYAVLVGAGLLIGLLGSAFAMRRYLKV